MLLHAHAKINLCLDVIGRRPNGYHDVKMIMQSIGLYDELEITTRPDNEIVLECDNSELGPIEDNLIYRAAAKLRESSGNNTGLTIRLTKNIPVAAGMAGGSTDAAATLIGINELLQLGKSHEDLREIGVTLGADVPYCIEGGTYLSEGIGEILTRLPDAPSCYLVIAKPDISVSTKFVYEHLILNDSTIHPDVDGMIDAIKSGSLQGVTNRLSNLLADVTEQEYTIIRQMKQVLLNNSALGALMSGSGPTVFGIYNSRTDADTALAKLHECCDFKAGFVTELSKTGVEIIR